MFAQRYKKLIGFTAVLVIILVQFFAQVHATDHPFHQDDVLCIALHSAQQDLHFFQNSAYSDYDNAYIAVSEGLDAARITSFLFPHYSSRAPPQTAA